jgi:hypothetical protein
MRHTEFWTRMHAAFGDEAYARHWASQQVMRSLGGRTPREALDAGESPKAVWAAVWEDLGLSISDR